MVKINNYIRIDKETLEVFDKQFDNGNSPLTEDDVRQMKKHAERMNCKVPNSVVIYDYISQNVKDEIRGNFETHLGKIKLLIS